MRKIEDGEILQFQDKELQILYGQEPIIRGTNRDENQKLPFFKVGKALMETVNN